MGGVDKTMAPLAGRPLLWHSVAAFERSPWVDEIVVVTREDLEDSVRALFAGEAFPKVRAVTRGGATRQESSRRGVAALSGDREIVLIHDGARPLVSDAVIARVVGAAVDVGAALPGVPPVATIKREEDGRSAETLDRTRLREAQTPQGFRRDVLARALAAAEADGYAGTDEASLVERAGDPVACVEGERRNLKVTVPEDLTLAAALLGGGGASPVPRIGYGLDIHRLVPGRPLILGGVEIPHALGLEGHSDADVVAHAICDALLGAVAAGDIGEHFPDTDDTWKGASGARLLAGTVEILRGFGYVPVNVDVAVSAQAPKLAPYRAEMRANVARALGLSENAVSIKFGTTERLGFEGREEGMSATAVALVVESPNSSE